MKKLIIVLLIITITLAVRFAYVQLVFQHSFGPLSVLFLSILGCLSLLLSITLAFYETRRREAIAKMWLMIIPFFITYVIVDLVSSYFLIQTLSPLSTADRYRGHKLVPNTRFAIKTREYNYVQTVNNLGLRGRNIEIKKALDHYRILMLGDSFTMGKGVADDKTFSALLEQSLNAKNNTVDKKTIEVLNAGVDSYSPILSFFQLTKDLRPLKPDLVVLNLDMSDLLQDTAYRKNATYGATGEIIGIDGRSRELLRQKIRHWIDRNLYITRLILFYLAKTFSRQTDITVENVVERITPALLEHTLAEDTVDRTEQWQNIFDSTLKIKTYCDGSGMKFLLTVYPWGHQVNDKEWVPGKFAGWLPESAVVSDKSIEIIQKFSVRNNIALLNLFPAFRSYNGTSRLYFRHDMHFTPAGHKLMAQELEQYIRATYFKK